MAKLIKIVYLCVSLCVLCARCVVNMCLSVSVWVFFSYSQTKRIFQVVEQSVQKGSEAVQKRFKSCHFVVVGGGVVHGWLHQMSRDRRRQPSSIC